jgi:hypothetical protein
MLEINTKTQGLIFREYNISNIYIALSAPEHLINKLIYLSGCDLKLRLNKHQFEMIENERFNQ